MTIKDINQCLKAGRLKVAIESRTNPLYLRAKFPPKPNSHHAHPHREAKLSDLSKLPTA